MAIQKDILAKYSQVGGTQTSILDKYKKKIPTPIITPEDMTIPTKFRESVPILQLDKEPEQQNIINKYITPAAKAIITPLTKIAEMHHKGMVEAAKAWEVTKIPAQKFRDLGVAVADIAEKIPWEDLVLQPDREKDAYWDRFIGGLPRVAIESLYDVVSIKMEPEILALSGFGKIVGPVIGEIEVAKTLKGIGRAEWKKGLKELLHFKKVHESKKIAEAMVEKFPEFSRIGVENTHKVVKGIIDKMGGWKKWDVKKSAQFISELDKFVVKPTVTPELARLPQKIQPKAIKPIEKPVKPIVEKPVVKGVEKIKNSNLSFSDKVNELKKLNLSDTELGKAITSLSADKKITPIAKKETSGLQNALKLYDEGKIESLDDFIETVRSLDTKDTTIEALLVEYDKGVIEDRFEYGMRASDLYEEPAENIINYIRQQPTPTVPPKPITPTPTPKVAEKGVTEPQEAIGKVKVPVAEPFTGIKVDSKFSLDDLLKLDADKAVSLNNADFDRWQNLRFTNNAVGDKDVKGLQELHKALVLKGELDSAEQTIDRIGRLSERDKDGNIIQANVIRNKKLEAIKKEMRTFQDTPVAPKAVIEPVKPEVKIKKQIKETELSGENDMPVGMSMELLRPKTISEAKANIKKLIRSRYGETQEGMLDSLIFRSQLKKDIPSLKERQALTFMLEKTKAPEQYKELNELIKKPTSAMLKKEREIRKYLDEGHAYIMENTGEDVGFIENYVNHVWDIPKNKVRETINWFTKLNPNTKKRFISTYKAGIEKGLTPKTLDIDKLLAFYDQYKVKVTANIKFANHLVNMKDETGMNLVQRIDKAPEDWKILDHWAFRRARLIGIAGEKPILMKMPVRVHPDIIDEVKVILDKPYDSKGLKTLNTINAYLKKSQLTFSLFHHVALTETAFATPKMIKPTIQMWNPIKIYDSLVKGNYDVLKKSDIAKDGVRHGLQLGALEDVQRHRVQKSLDSLVEKTKHIPFIRKATSGISKANELWDKALWDYYHNGLKLNAYENLVEWGIKKNPDVNADKLKDEIAQFVNDTFGGQSWDLLLKNPKWRQAMHLILLSPDWTYSTIRQALSPFGIGAVHDETKFFRKKMGRGFWIRAMLYFWGTINLMNYGLTKKKTGKGKWMWENDPGHKTHLFLGYNKEGTKQYLRWGKQFRELPEFIADPIKKISGKASPVLHQIVKQATKHSITGWATPFADKSFYDSLPDRLIELLKAPIPFSMKQMIQRGEFQPLGIAMPISRGMTPFTTRKHFKQAINEENADYVIEVGIAAKENNLNARELFDNTMSSMLSDKRYELRRKYKVKDLRSSEKASQKYRAYRSELEQLKRKIYKEIR